MPSNNAFWKIRVSGLRRCFAELTTFVVFDRDGWSVYVVPVSGGHSARVFLSYNELVHETFAVLTSGVRGGISACFIINAFALQRYLFLKDSASVRRHNFW